MKKQISNLELWYQLQITGTVQLEESLGSGQSKKKANIKILQT